MDFKEKTWILRRSLRSQGEVRKINKKQHQSGSFV